MLHWAMALFYGLCYEEMLCWMRILDQKVVYNTGIGEQYG